MEFKAKDRVIVVNTHSTTLANNGDKGTVLSVDDEGYLEVDFDNGGSCEAWQSMRFEKEECTVKATEFKVGDAITVVSHRGFTKKAIGSKGIIDGVEGSCGETMYSLDIDTNFYYYAEELALESSKPPVAAPTPMSYRDALLHTINGTMTVRHTSMKSGEYLVFDGTQWGLSSGGGCGINYVNYKAGNWEQYIVPTPPLLTIDSLVYNTDGTIGKVVEDKGITKGERWYSIAFNAVKVDKVRSVKESELTLYA
jgi:hypothetical protein